MKYFDLHIDTLTSFENIQVNSGQVDITRLKKNNYVGQLFAIFLKEGVNDKLNVILDLLNKLDREIKNDSELSVTFDKKKIWVIKSLENSSVLLENDCLNELIHRGVYVYGLTWNDNNPICCSCLCSNSTLDKGVTKKGKQLLKKLQQVNAIIDLSHSSDKTSSYVLNHYLGPVIYSHSNSRAICNSFRNVTDKQVKLIVKRGGLIGLNLYTKFLGNGEDDLNDLMKHILHFLKIGAENVLCLGSDFDGIPVKPPFLSCNEIHLINDMMIKKKIPLKIRNKILYKNAQNFFAINCKKLLSNI